MATTRRTFLTSIGAFAVLGAVAGCSSVTSGSSAASGASSGALPSGVRSATAINKVFGDGLRFIAIAIEYAGPIASAKLSTSAFAVADRTVTKVYANTSAALADAGTDGAFVIVELSRDDASAALWDFAGEQSMSGGPGGSSSSGSADRPSAMPSGQPTGGASGAPSGSGSAGAGGAGLAQSLKSASASITQAAAISGTDGTSYPATTTSFGLTAAKNLIMDEFRQLSFTDSSNGNTLPYNLFTPAGYDKTTSYPLVLFMHDATVSGTDPRNTLAQGLGAISWASPEDQAKRPAFVLAPQFAGAVTGDDFTASNLLDTIVNLVKSLTTQYSIDTSRLYTTGQSGGAMNSLAIDVKYPDLFAASYIVAGQWDPEPTAKAMAGRKQWIMVAEGDEKAHPYQDKITAALEKLGTTVTRATWNGAWSDAKFAAAVKAVAAHGTPVNYTMFAKGTVIPPGQTDNTTTEHLNTWRIAYSIPGIRAWIFEQSK